YCQSRMSLNSKSGSIKIKRNKKVFELYKSGDSINAQNVILKFFIFGVVIFVLLVGFFYWFISSKTPDNEIENNTSLPAQQSVSVQQSAPAQQSVSVQQSAPVQQFASVQQSASVQYASPAPTSVNENILFNLNCSDVSCSNEDINIPPDLITYFVKEKKIKILYSKKVTSKYFKFYFDSTKDFYNYLKLTKGVKNEENFNSFATDKLTNQGG
ncbi:MAG: zona occludens toxin, partial [Campylobacterota bacterium]|nr:zona occludens toxin [Campylobacterota bacterium]